MLPSDLLPATSQPSRQMAAENTTLSPAGLRLLLVAARYADSAYPAGGYAQSWGLETATAAGHVRDAATLARATASNLRHGVAPAEAVATAATCRAAPDADTATFITVDRRLAATRAARELREASTRTGRRLLQTAARAERDPWLAALNDLARTGATPGNWAAALGAVLGRLGLTPDAAATLTLWTALNATLAAAQRLIPITHDDVQAIQSHLLPLCATLGEEAAHSSPTTLAASTPMFEIFAMHHETGRHRLFAS